MRSVPNPGAGAIERICSEYTEMVRIATRFSLLNLFKTDIFDFAVFCADYTPHADLGRLKQLTREFGSRYDILLPDADYYITCCLYLYPGATFERILLLSKLFAVDFYLNDTMGRDAQPTDQERQRLYEIRDRLATLGEDLDMARAISTAEKANIGVLDEISREAPKAWFRPFLKLYLQHIDAAHKPYDTAALGYIPAIDAYVEARRAISGMPHTVSLVEYSNDTYLDWDMLEKAGIEPPLRQIGWVVSVIGALTNDLFSFEKEVIDKGSDANLLVVLVMNNFRMKLGEAIRLAGSIIRDLLTDYISLQAQIEQRLREAAITTDQRRNIGAYLEGLKTVLQTCWMWQATTRRYKRPISIWKETAIDQPAVA